MRFQLSTLVFLMSLLCIWLSLALSDIVGFLLATALCYSCSILGVSHKSSVDNQQALLRIAVTLSRGMAALTCMGVVIVALLAANADVEIPFVWKWMRICLTILGFTLITLGITEWLLARVTRNCQLPTRASLSLGLLGALQIVLIGWTLQLAPHSVDLRLRGSLLSFEQEWLISFAIVNMTTFVLLIKVVWLSRRANIRPDVVAELVDKGPRT